MRSVRVALITFTLSLPASALAFARHFGLWWSHSHLLLFPELDQPQIEKSYATIALLPGQLICIIDLGLGAFLTILALFLCSPMRLLTNNWYENL